MSVSFGFGPKNQTMEVGIQFLPSRSHEIPQLPCVPCGGVAASGGTGAKQEGTRLGLLLPGARGHGEGPSRAARHPSGHSQV